jgi:putative endonuclease
VHTIEFGLSVESLVAEFLQGQGLRLVHKNYACRLGEIDLVLQDESDGTIVFVEVRYRSNWHHGGATASVDWKKQRKLRRVVLHYLQKHGSASTVARLDVIGVSAIKPPDSTSGFGVLLHQYNNHYLIWTINAIEAS